MDIPGKCSESVRFVNCAEGNNHINTQYAISNFIYENDFDGENLHIAIERIVEYEINILLTKLL